MQSQTDTLQGASDCIWKDFEAIAMFRGYSNSLIFLLIHSLSTLKWNKGEIGRLPPS